MYLTFNHNYRIEIFILEHLSTVKMSFQELCDKKDAIEKEIKELVDVLEPSNAVGPVPGLKKPLVDHEGFPRNDIDVYDTRHKRHRLACLQTDHKQIMKEIEAFLIT